MAKRKRTLELAGTFNNIIPVDNTRVVTPVVKNQKSTSFFKPYDSYLYDGVFTDADAVPYKLVEKGNFQFDKRYLTKQEIDDFIKEKQVEKFANFLKRTIHK